MKPSWMAISTLTIGILSLFLAPAFFASSHNNVALLERLAPRIERTSTLAPETRDAILQLVDSVRNAPADQRSESRRALAIERVTTAIQSRDSSHELSSVGRRPD